MDDLERRYKVKLRKKYQQDYSAEKDEAVVNAIAVGGFAIACVFNVVVCGMSMALGPLVTTLATLVTAEISGKCIIDYLVKLVKSISKLIILEVDIDKITAELEAFDLANETNKVQEREGRRR